MVMRKDNPAAIAFVVVVWTTLILLMANKLYNNLINEDTPGSLNFTLKNMEDLNDGNP